MYPLQSLRPCLPGRQGQHSQGVARMKVYLSTAITRGRREYVDAVRNIFDALKEEGVHVLNERIADPNFPDPQTDRAETMRDVHGWLNESDALIAEATISSTGGGCELTQVQMRG